ncbi:MAG: helicase [Circoviridae sp.]|nr:MAG: helicase [Circoviridae sp.]
MTQARNICWTLHTDYNEETEQGLADIFEAWEGCTYTVFQWEICPETKKEHVQGYSEFKHGVRWTTFQNRIGPAHCEKRRGTSFEAAEYCKKTDSRHPQSTPVEYGTASGGQGTRTDLASAADGIMRGCSLRQVAIEDPVCFVRHHRGLTALQTTLRLMKRTWKPEVVILWGPPGTGKTRSVYDTHGFDNVYEVPTPRSGSEVWFDGYQGEEVILVDDFYGWLRWSFLLKFIDRYPQDLPVKGGFTPNLARKIYFTSNQDPMQWYSYSERMQWDALARRVDDIQFIE